MSKQIKVGALTFALVIEALQDGPQSVNDLVEVTGCHPGTIRGYMRALKAKRCVFIAEYQMTQGRAPSYCLGRRADAVRPPALGPRACYWERKRRAAAQRLSAAVLSPRAHAFSEAA